jgi:predicted RNA-binding Zn ribbon-like protein
VNFGSHYDAPVRLAALLVNALTDGHMRGRPYPSPQGEQRREAATEVLRSISPDIPTVAAHEADDLATLAATLRSVFASVADGDLDTAAEQVNRLLDDTRAQPRLNRHDEQLWHLHYHGTTGGLAATWAGACATALAIVLGSDSRHRLGICTAPRCDRVYVDTSHNGIRRFCSTPCQNRVKTAAFRARIQSDQKQH